MRHQTEPQQLTIDGSREVPAVRGAGRKKADIKTVTLSVRIPEEVHQQMRVGARRLGVSVSGFARLLLHQGSKLYMPDNW